MRPISFDHLDETEFEAFCYDLLIELGFSNVDWRKGTGLSSSPSDRGRDIVAERIRVDIDGSKHLETWFIECKHYQRGVPPDKLQSLLAWAEAECPHTALVICSNFLSNGSKDNLEAYKKNRKPPFEIRYWEKPVIERLTRRKRELLERHDIIGVAERTLKEIVAAEQEMFDKVWYNRHMVLEQKIELGVIPEPGPNSGWKIGLEAARKLEEKHGIENLGPWDDFEWGMINGKLSALRWVLGDEWDFLDT